MPKVTKQKTTTRRTKSSRIRASAIDRIEPIGFGANDGVKINLYGRSGTGKTTLWATFPKPILALVCSGGKKPGELRSINTAAYRKTIKQATMNKSSDVAELVEYQQREGKFATLVLDHATSLQDLVLKEILGLDELPAQGSWGMARREDWGQCALQMKEILRALLSLDCNVIIVAQEREFDSEYEGELLMPYVASALTPSVVGWLNPACDYICQTFKRQRTVEKEIKVGRKKVRRQQKVKGAEYCLRTGPHPIYEAKFRLPKGSELPDVIVDPDFDKIKELIDQGG